MPLESFISSGPSVRVRGRKGDWESRDSESVQQPCRGRMETGIEGSSQLWSVSGCADALWVWQLIGLQQSEVEIGSMPWSSLLSIPMITAIPLSIRHGGPSESTGGMAGVGNVITVLSKYILLVMEKERYLCA